MGDLIWIGTTLLPRGIVYGAILLAIIVAAIVITRVVKS